MGVGGLALAMKPMVLWSSLPSLSFCNWHAGGVAAIVAALLRDGTAPAQMGPVRSTVVSPAAVFDGQLSEACRPFITSLILRSGAYLTQMLCMFSANAPHPQVWSFLDIDVVYVFCKCLSTSGLLLI